MPVTPRHASRLFRLGIWSLVAAVFGVSAVGARAQSPTADAQARITVEDIRGVFDRPITASDAGERTAFARFGQLYQSLYEQALYEAGADVPKTAAGMIRELDHWLLDRAIAGSPSAQFWMGERAKVLQEYGGPKPDVATATNWFRRSAEQGFGPAQDSLGQLLGFFPELAEKPFEAQTWLYRAALQGEPAADERLLLAIEIDHARARHKPPADIHDWLKQRAANGDVRAAAIIHQLDSTAN